MKTSIYAACLMTVLTACGEAEVIASAPIGPTIDDLEAEEVRLTDQLDAYFVAGDAAIPPSSDASYSGVMFVVRGFGAGAVEYLGEMTATYTLATETLDGSATGFLVTAGTDPAIAATGDAVEGTVTFNGSGLSAGQISSVTAAGTVNGEALSGSGFADFFGPDGEMFAVETPTATLGGRTGAYMAAYGE